MNFWSFFHRHLFRLSTRCFSGTVPETMAIHGGDGDFQRAMRFGITTHVYLCACGETKKVEAWGREERGVMEIKFSEVKK